MPFQNRTICCKIFKQISDRIALGLELTGVEGNSARGLGPDAYRVVDIIRPQTGVFDFLHGEVARELVHDGGYHLQVGQFLGPQRSIGNVSQRKFSSKFCVSWALGT